MWIPETAPEREILTLENTKSMRIIAGTARGRRLATLQGDRVRPTLDRVREALFNIWNDRVPGARFLDLFAGSGANGIEALSRGAASCLFVDSYPASVACIKQNLETTRLDARGRCLRAQLPADLHRVPGPYDLIFIDPPYAYDSHAQLLEKLGAQGLLAPEGCIAVEHASKAPLPESAGPLTQTQSRRYGATCLSFFA